MDILAFLLVVLLIVVPIGLLIRYGYSRGRQSFFYKVVELEDAKLTRKTVILTSFKVAIIPALVSLFGSIRIRVTRRHEGDEEMVLQLAVAIALILLVLVILPFLVGVQVGYQKDRATNG